MGSVVRLGMMKRERNMMKFKIEDMKVFSDESFEERFGFEVSEWDESDESFKESGVFRIEVGSRGEIEDVVKVEVIDGVLEVESVEEILNSMDEEDREGMRDWVDVEFDERNGIVMKSIGDELCFEYVRVEV
jgi:hypothetical protein